MNWYARNKRKYNILGCYYLYRPLQDCFEAYNHTYLLAYLLTPWSRALLEKLTGSQVAKKFPTIWENRKFITAFTSGHHLSLSWASSIQSIPLHSTSWRFILLIFSHLHLGLPGGLFPSGVPTEPCIRLSSPHMCYIPRPSRSSRFYHPKNTGWGV